MTLTDALAEQLGWQRNKDEPEEKDRQKAVGMVETWNQKRLAAGLKPLRDDYEPVFAGSIVVDVFDDSDDSDVETTE